MSITNNNDPTVSLTKLIEAYCCILAADDRGLAAFTKNNMVAASNEWIASTDDIVLGYVIVQRYRSITRLRLIEFIWLYSKLATYWSRV